MRGNFGSLCVVLVLFEKKSFDTISLFEVFHCEIFPSNAYRIRCDCSYPGVSQTEGGFEEQTMDNLTAQAADTAFLHPSITCALELLPFAERSSPKHEND